MKKAILTLFLALLFLRVSAPPTGIINVFYEAGINPYEEIWRVFCEVESKNDPFAVGDTHLDNYSFGIVQIRQIRLDDYCKRTGKSYSLQDCFNVKISKEIWYYYSTKFHPCAIESIARDWNGYGDSSIEYAERIKSKLYSLRL